MFQKKSEILDQIEADIISNNVCENLAQTAKNLVMGEGGLDARIMFIGEAPGKKEDELGRPFVGSAGKFLDEMLASIGMERGDVYITNIVKYRPPNNRDPEPEEKTAFLPYLVRQIEAIKPKVVATLGRHSMNLFLPDMQISKIHGQPKRVHLAISPGGTEAREAHTEYVNKMPAGLDAVQGNSEARSMLYREVQHASTGAGDTAMRQKTSDVIELDSRQPEVVQLVILPLYHPAAALYNGSMRTTLIEDFQKIPKILEMVNEKLEKERK